MSTFIAPMSDSRARAFSIALACILILSVATAFTSAWWHSALAFGAICLLGIGWALMAGAFQTDAISGPAWAAVTLIAIWGPAQLLAHSTVAPWLTQRESISWLASAIAFVVASQILSSERARHLFLNILLWAVLVFAVLAIVQASADMPLVYGIFKGDDTVVGSFLYKNQFAAMLELAGPIALWRALRGRETPVYGLLFFVVFLAAAVASTSRAGVIILAFEFVCAVAIALFRRRIPWSTAAALAGGLLVLGIAASAIAGPEKILEHFQEQNPYAIRRQLLDSTVSMIHERPWFGSGLGAWPLIYPRFATFDISLVANEAHNDWAQWAADGGIPFSCLMLVLVLSTVRAAFSTTWGLGVLMVMVHSFIDYPIREPAIGLLWFSFAGALLQAREASRSGPTSADRAGANRTRARTSATDRVASSRSFH